MGPSPMMAAAGTRLSGCPRSAGAVACIALEGSTHLIGGAIGLRRTAGSIDWHVVYDPQADAYTRRQPMPVGRDHTSMVHHMNGVVQLDRRPPWIPSYQAEPPPHV